jgi:hypothetical protein
VVKLAVATIGPTAALPGFIVEPQVAPQVPVSLLSVSNESTNSTRSHGGGTRRRRAAPSFAYLARTRATASLAAGATCGLSVGPRTPIIFFGL